MLSLTTTIPRFQEKIVKTRQQAGGPDPVQRRNPSKKIPETHPPVVGGTNLTQGRITLWPVVGGTDPTLRRSATSVDLGGRIDLTPGKNPTPAYSWGNKPNPKKESHVRRHGRHSRLGMVYTHPSTTFCVQKSVLGRPCVGLLDIQQRYNISPLHNPCNNMVKISLWSLHRRCDIWNLLVLKLSCSVHISKSVSKNKPNSLISIFS